MVISSLKNKSKKRTIKKLYKPIVMKIVRLWYRNKQRDKWNNLDHSRWRKPEQNELFRRWWYSANCPP